jgi:uncharacterized RDD family membrane protein YckC
MENTDQILDAPVSQEKVFAYAGFWIRVGAYLIDAILVGVVNTLITFSLTATSPILGSLVSLALGIAYFAFMESSENQATLGKMAVGIKVGDINGDRISVGNAVGRYFAKILSAITLCIGFMMVGWDAKNQGLHDKLADTFVFYK